MKGGEAYAWRAFATGGAALISDEVSADRVGTVDYLSEALFRLHFPPSSGGTTGISQEHRSRKNDSICTCYSARMIMALERRERAAQRGNIDTYIFHV
jgi:hypothetical protein